jgi:hypothetical protein
VAVESGRGEMGVGGMHSEFYQLSQHMLLFGGRNRMQGIGGGTKGKGKAASFVLWRVSE